MLTRLRRLVLAASALMCVAAGPPPVLQPYVKDGRFDPGDYGWARGMFPGASPDQLASEAALDQWLNDCMKQGHAETVRELQELGVAKPQIDRLLPRDPLCLQVTAARPLPTMSFGDLQKAAAEARPVFRSFLFAVELAEAQVGGEGTERQLRGRVLAEQMLRNAWPWGTGNAASAPRLSANAEVILNQLIGLEMGRRDHSNTGWLKEQVARNGWPRKSQHGDEAAGGFWLLAQHADRDPAFQLKALRLMEPLAKVGEVDRSQFALLTDRVLLKTTGKQRYGTQTHCVKNQWEIQPVENVAKLAELRAEAGLPPLADYLKTIREMFGPCTSPV